MERQQSMNDHIASLPMTRYAHGDRGHDHDLAGLSEANLRAMAIRLTTLNSASAVHATEPVGPAGTPASLPAAKPLRVLLVTARYFPHVGGTEIHTYEVARRFVAEGNHVTVLTTDLAGELPIVEEAEGVRIVRVRAWPANSDYYFAPNIYHMIMRDTWDIIHIQGYHTFVAPLAMLAAWRAGIPYIVSFHSGGHSSRLRNAGRRLQHALLRPLLARAQRLIAVSEFEAAFFHKRLRLPRDKFLIIENGSYLPQAPDPLVNKSDGTVIVSVGRLERYKGHHRVIAALPSLLARRPDIHLRIVGAGPYDSALRRMAQELGVAHRVEIGAISGSDRQGMAAVLSGAKLVILLSDYESQGIAVMEALALGRPVLVADTSALHELVHGGLVRATPLGSTPEEVAAAVLWQLEHPLVPTKVDLPTWDACAARIMAVYRRCIGELQCGS